MRRKLLLASVSLAAACSSDAVQEWRDPAPHTARYLTVNGVRLDYLDWGGSGDPVVLVHGLAASPHNFDSLASGLASDYRIVAYARRGHGRSETRPPFDVATLTEDLRLVLDSLGLEHVYLAGWSYGGYEITRFAELYPDRVRGLIYLDASEEWGDSAWVAAVASLPIVRFAPTAPDLASLDAYRTWYRSGFFDSASWSPAHEAAFRDIGNVQPDGQVIPVPRDSVTMQLFGAIMGHRKNFQAIRAPVLSILAATLLSTQIPDQDGRLAAWTAKHDVPFRRATAARLRAEIPNGQIVELDNDNHYTFLDSPVVLQAIRRFLRSTSAGQ